MNDYINFISLGIAFCSLVIVTSVFLHCRKIEKKCNYYMAKSIRDSPGSPPCRAQSSSPKGPIVQTHRTESGILHVPSAVFQELHNFMFLSLCTLRIDKSIRNMYNKARNQRSTAEAQERANPADLKQKGARPMVDMEPAQQGQAVGIR